MELWQMEGILQRINGCTFASMDTRTVPVLMGGIGNPMQGRVEKTTMNTRVMLFTNKNVSGYEQMVRRRLKEAGKDPDTFVLGELKWGVRVPGTPLIFNKGEHYLQCVVLKAGECIYYVGGEEIAPENIPGLRRDQDYANQGLEKERQVIVRCYKLSSIFNIRLLGVEIVVDDPPVFRHSLEWEPHHMLPKHRVAKYKGCSIVNGPLVAVDATYEVHSPEGNIARFNSEAGVEAYLMELDRVGLA